jgi:predicted Zn-dependent protease
MKIQEALFLHLAGEQDEAELAVLDCVAGTSHDGDSANTLSLIYGQRGDEVAELRYAEMAAKLVPGNAVFMGNFGCVLANLGRRDEAVARLRAAMAIDPNLSYLYENLGDIYREAGDEASALREYHQAIRVSERDSSEQPESPRFWHVLARLYQKIGDYDKAADARASASDAGLNEVYGGDHRQRIAGPDSGF